MRSDILRREPQRPPWPSGSAMAWFVCSLGAGTALALNACRQSVLPPLCDESTGTEIYERRIAPVLVDDRPKSCNECHLSGVDLTLFARETPCETLACMQDLGLVDLASPEDSLILKWIDRASPSSPLITEAIIAEEYEGMREWLEYYSGCGLAECAGIQCGDGKREVFCELTNEPLAEQGRAVDPGGCSEVALELLFRETIYASRRRCFPCHSDDESRNFPTAGHWLIEGDTCAVSSLRTMRNLIERNLINVDDPEQSLLLLKPLDQSEGGIQHGGLDKFHPGDANYEDMLYWLTRYGQCNANQ